MTPFAAPRDYPQWPEVAALIHRSFAYMTARLGHPPRAASVTPAQLADAAGADTAWLIEANHTPVACAFTRPSRDFPDALYLGWLAVDEAHRGTGLAEALLAAAEQEARDRGIAAMTLDTGRALTELHGFFQRLGFRDIPGDGEIITFRKALARSRGNGDSRP